MHLIITIDVNVFSKLKTCTLRYNESLDDMYMNTFYTETNDVDQHHKY